MGREGVARGRKKEVGEREGGKEREREGGTQGEKNGGKEGRREGGRGAPLGAAAQGGWAQTRVQEGAGAGAGSWVPLRDAWPRPRREDEAPETGRKGNGRARFARGQAEGWRRSAGGQIRILRFFPGGPAPLLRAPGRGGTASWGPCRRLWRRPGGAEGLLGRPRQTTLEKTWLGQRGASGAQEGAG